jgi:sulfur-oxidizing protein SoxX
MEKKSLKPAVAVLAVIGIIFVFWLGYTTSQNVMHMDEAAGFRLPPGDEEAGKVAFVELGCVNCHSVAGSEQFPEVDEPGKLHIVLGGEVRLPKTYGELVTGVIHPTESIRPEYRKQIMEQNGGAQMPDLTRQMTTRQMIDIVTWLQHQYKVVLPEYPSNYYPYGIEMSPP